MSVYISLPLVSVTPLENVMNFFDLYKKVV